MYQPPQPPEGSYQPSQPSQPSYAQQSSQPYPPGFQQQAWAPQPSYQQQPAMPYAQPPMMQPAMQQSTFVNVNVQQRQAGGCARALYFVFIGSWLGFLWLNFGFALCAFIVTLPLGLVMLNRLPQVLTLRSPGNATNVNVATSSMMMQGGMVSMQNVNVSVGGTVQYSFLIRALYFVLFGFWAGYIWACIGYAFCLSLLGLPVGLMMLNRLPMVLTLRRN